MRTRRRRAEEAQEVRKFEKRDDGSRRPAGCDEAHGFVRIMHQQDRDHAGLLRLIETCRVVGDIHGFARFAGLLKLNSHLFKLGECRGDVFVGAVGVREAG